jgi:hypothetical protein
MRETRQIYVALLDEAVPVWRPVEAERLPEDEYRLIGPIPESEVWEFQPGDVIRCRPRTFADGTTALVAVERVSRDA